MERIFYSVLKSFDFQMFARGCIEQTVDRPVNFFQGKVNTSKNEKRKGKKESDSLSISNCRSFLTQSRTQKNPQ